MLRCVKQAEIRAGLATPSPQPRRGAAAAAAAARAVGGGAGAYAAAVGGGDGAYAAAAGAGRGSFGLEAGGPATVSECPSDGGGDQAVATLLGPGPTPAAALVDAEGADVVILAQAAERKSVRGGVLPGCGSPTLTPLTTAATASFAPPAQ
jgi:hypothetical protein